MRIAGGCLIVALAAGAATAQTKSQQKPNTKSITLSGCVVRSETTPVQYTLEDKQAGTTYRLTGVDFRDYIGRPVIIVGSGAKKLTVVGGLTPTPNIAAQAGDIDPARAAVAAQTAAASKGNNDVPEFRVKSIRPAQGSCPE
ncbi:MAG TPA: hypothetical protein VKE51_06000 [Vicinamibacterales bacterium]|nr:hypothetical protein [Vicinamibacterales bacterium]